MYSVTSDNFNNLISKSGRTFRARLVIDSKTMLEGFLSLKLNYCSNNGDALTIGSTISQYAEIEIEKPTISLEKKEFRLEIGLLLEDGTYEYVPMGMLTADKVQKKKFSVSFQAFDRMMKLSVGYVPTVVDSTNTIDVLNDISKQTGVPIKTIGLNPISMKKPVGMTCREVLMYISQMYASFAIVNRTGTIEIVFYKSSSYILDTKLGINNLIKSDSYTVERISCATGQDADGKTISISAGTGSNTISISNQFMTQTILNSVFASLNGFKYDAVDCPVILGDPRLDPWDIITITDVEGVSYKVPLMNISYTYDGGLSCIIKSTVASTTETDNDFKGPMQQFEDRVLANIAVIKSLTADKATIKDLEALNIKVDNIVAGEVTVEYLKANYASIEYLKANYTSTQKLEAEYAKVKDLDVKYATIEKLTTEYLTAKQLEATYAKIQDLDVKYATIEKLNTEYLTAKQIEAKYATITELHSEYITANKIEAEYARLDKANIEDGWITNAMIGTGVIGTTQIADGSITDAKIVGLTANKITAGRLDAAEIEVVNLNCANLTVGTINGQQISQGTIDFGNLNSQVSGTINSADKNATQALADALNAMKEAQAAKEKAGAALTSANGKNKNYYQTTAPTGGTYVVGDTWFNTAKDMQISHWNGTAWVVEEIGAGALESGSISADKIASDVNKKIEDAFSKAGIAVTDSTTAKNTANNALSTANTAKTTADSALSKANTANSNASSALNKANAVQATADGKNTVFYQTTAPSTSGRKVNDIWFDTDDGNKMYYWNGTAWTVRQFGTSAIANAAITNALIADATIQNAKIANLDAAKITTGYLSAARLKVGSITADKLVAKTLTSASGVFADACILTANIKDLAVTGTKIADATIGTAKIANLAVTGAKIADATITNAKIANLDAGKITSGYISADRIQAGSLVIGKLDSATQNAINGSTKRYEIIADLTETKYDVNTYYPVVLNNRIPANGYNTYECNVQLNSGSKPSWASHSSGFTCNLIARVKANGWGGTDGKGWIEENYFQFCDKMPAFIQQLSYTSKIVFYLRGGGKYFLYSPVQGSVSIYTAKTNTNSSSYPQYVEPTKTPANQYVTMTPSIIGSWCATADKTYINGGKIYTGTVTANQLAANSVIAGKIAANAISAGNIVAGAITTDKLSANAVTSAKIAAGAITADKIVAGAITGAKIAASTITANNIAANAITASKIAAGTITADKIATKTITVDKLNITSLSAISANLGSVTAATITNKRDGQNAIILNSDNISFYDWANGGQYAGKIASGHIGGTTSLSELDIIAQNYLCLNAPHVLINNTDIDKELAELNSKLKTRNVIIAEKSQTFSVNKGAALTKNFSFDAKTGYTRNLFVFYISGTGSDSAVVNMHANGNVSVFAPNMNSNITVIVRCLYTPD